MTARRVTGGVSDSSAGALAPQRQARIVDEVTRLGGVRVSDLTRLLGVSDMTVRRDLDALAGRGLVAKVHGGATTVESGTTEEPGFEAKAVRDLSEKEAIALRAADFVQPGSAVALTAGTTTWTLAAYLATIPSLTIVTNSMRVADVLHQRQRHDQTVIVTGGVRTPSDALVGPVAVATIRSLHLDVVFMGVHGIHVVAGLTTPNLMEAETNRAFVSAARRLVVVADHTKWGVVGLSQIAPLDAVDVWVVDALPPDASGSETEAIGEIAVASAGDGSSSRSVS